MKIQEIRHFFLLYVFYYYMCKPQISTSYNLRIFSKSVSNQYVIYKYMYPQFNYLSKCVLNLYGARFINEKFAMSDTCKQRLLKDQNDMFSHQAFFNVKLSLFCHFFFFQYRVFKQILVFLVYFTVSFVNLY